MGKSKKILLITLPLLFAVGWAGFFAVRLAIRQKALNAVLQNKDVRARLDVVPEPRLALTADPLPAGAERFSIGYAEFHLATKEPVHVFTRHRGRPISVQTSEWTLNILPPRAENSAVWPTVHGHGSEQLRQIVGEARTNRVSRLDVTLLAASERPLPRWRMALMSQRDFAAHAALLGWKSVTLKELERTIPFTSPHTVGMIHADDDPARVMVELTTHDRTLSQMMVLKPASPGQRLPPAELLALLSTYRLLVTSAPTPPQLLEIAAALPPPPEPPAAATPPTPASAVQDYQLEILRQGLPPLPAGE